MENITNWNIIQIVVFGNYIDLSAIQQESR